MKLFNKILVANRGEIAVRVMHSAKKLGIKTVAIYSSVDKDSLHVTNADESYSLGETVELSDTYLDIEKIIKIAKESGAEAIHPGYGFLSENPLLVAACEKERIVFIGPNTRSIELMGNKIESRKFVKELGIPMTEAKTGEKKVLLQAAKEIPFPLLVKAAAGGGGKGMRIVRNESELEETIESTSREAQSYFGDGTVFVEKYVEKPRHIEIQVIGDNFGNAVHLFERECSIQRRYQKIIEESPSPTINDQVRNKMGKAAVRIAKEIGYNNAGTVEFLVDKEMNFYFLEMNTRVQVEHPVTELVTGVDIVREQILIAAGNELSFKQDQIRQRGHAIECRIYAENPLESFMPSPGDISFYQAPVGENIRVDSGIDKATTIHSFYDPMISKLVVWGKNREIARENAIKALKNYHIHGIHTNISFLKEMLYHDAYIKNEITTKFCDQHIDEINEASLIRKNKIGIHIPILGYLLYDLSKEDLKSMGIWKHIGFWRELMRLAINCDEKIYQIELLSARDRKFIFVFENKEYVPTIMELTNNSIVFKVADQVYSAIITETEGGDHAFELDGNMFKLKRKDVLIHEDLFGSVDTGDTKNGKITSPMPGKVIKINVEKDALVEKGDVLLVVEAMKMENNIISPRKAKVDLINVQVGDMVNGSKELISFVDA